MSKTPTKTLRQHGDQYMKLLMLHFLKKRKISTIFLNLRKNNPNQPQFLPSYVKIVLERMLMEQGLYSKMVMIC